MSLLGAIFAGGQSRRFGSDKALADVGGRALFERAADALRDQCDALVVVGRDWPGMIRVNDLPAPGLGPLGALAGALTYAAEHGFDEVLTTGCDLPALPERLAERLTPAPSVAKGQPLLGRWPSGLAAPLVAYLDAGGDRAMRAWITQTGARRIDLGPIANINTPEELAHYLAGS